MVHWRSEPLSEVATALLRWKDKSTGLCLHESTREVRRLLLRNINFLGHRRSRQHLLTLINLRRLFGGRRLLTARDAELL